MPAEQDVSCVQPDHRLPTEHPARVIAALVDEHLDLACVRARGVLPYDPRLMAALLYAYTTGVWSSRAIERRCVDDVAFRWLAVGASPGYRAIAEFRNQHPSALGYLLEQALGREVSALLASAERIDAAEDAAPGSPRSA